jgi:hypothetical protein
MAQLTRQHEGAYSNQKPGQGMNSHLKTINLKYIKLIWHILSDNIIHHSTSRILDIYLDNMAK